jgi:hypothetical protein
MDKYFSRVIPFSIGRRPTICNMRRLSARRQVMVQSDTSTPKADSMKALTQARSHFSSDAKIAPQTMSHCSPVRAPGRPLFFSLDKGASPQSISATWSNKVDRDTEKRVSLLAARKTSSDTPRFFNALASSALYSLTTWGVPADANFLLGVSIQKKNPQKKFFFCPKNFAIYSTPPSR